MPPARSNKRGPADPRRARRDPARARADHAPGCGDVGCAGCADGGVQLGDDVLGLPAGEILALAEQEEAAAADRAVVAALYEAALARFGDACSLPRAWALLRLAEFAGYGEYARQARAVAAQAGDQADRPGDAAAQALAIKGRARVLEVCLDPDNWRDGDGDGDGAVPRIAGEQALAEGLGELAEALRLPACAADVRIAAGAAAALVAQHERRPLVAPLRLATMDCALAAASRGLGWGAPGAPQGSDARPGLALVACRAAVYWALAASECAVAGSEIEERTRPAVAHLESAPSDAECCKLHAQILVVLSGTLDDEDAALAAFDAAVAALRRAQQISPGDADVARQLEDLGAQDAASDC